MATTTKLVTKPAVIYKVLATTGAKNRPYTNHWSDVRISDEDNLRDSSLRAIQQVVDKLRDELEPDVWMVSVGVFFRVEEE